MFGVGKENNNYDSWHIYLILLEDNLVISGYTCLLDTTFIFSLNLRDLLLLWELQLIPSSKYSTVFEIIVVKGLQLLTGKKSLSIPGLRSKFNQKVQLKYANTSYPRLFPCH